MQVISRWSRTHGLLVHGHSRKLFSSCSSPFDPLRIAFFGSDTFSAESLKQLYSLKQSDPSIIEDLQVLTRRPKRAGRGKTNVFEVPIIQYARDFNLPLHFIETDQDYHNAQSTNNFTLAVAVSFGKLIPGFFINGMKFGGLNLHPSSLPRHSGSSPLQYTILRNDKVTCASVQTLHPTKFDAGRVLERSTEILVDENETLDTLREKLALDGARVLSDVCIRISKLSDVTSFEQEFPLLLNKYPFSSARKITKDMHRIFPQSQSAKDIQRRYRAFASPLWTVKHFPEKGSPELKRVLLNDIALVDINNVSGGHDLQPGQFKPQKNRLLVQTTDGLLSIGEIKVEKKKAMDGGSFGRWGPKTMGQAQFEDIPIEK
ncbi:formyl transferase [Lipomyces japonicus]|uniref:formyl transferase n=1 Tax=Lipomyces japonicus TaxID=56871 RepID=UPI0034CDB499